MVQKDDPVYVNFEYRYPNNLSKSYNKTYQYTFKDAKSLSAEIKNDINLSCESKDYVIDRCIFKLLNAEVSITADLNTY
jgi:hypothetical protein